MTSNGTRRKEKRRQRRLEKRNLLSLVLRAEVISSRPQHVQQQEQLPESTNNAACHAVFSTYEFAETIFLELGMTDLLCGVMQTCKIWKSMVDQSARLQQALFFKPLPIPPLVYSWTMSEWVTKDTGEYHVAYRHPFLEKINELVHTANMYGEMSQVHRIAFANRLKFYSTSLCRTEATWRHALISQPPVELIHGGHGSAITKAKQNVGVVLEQILPQVVCISDFTKRILYKAQTIRADAQEIRFPGYESFASFESYNQIKTLLPRT